MLLSYRRPSFLRDQPALSNAKRRWHFGLVLVEGLHADPVSRAEFRDRESVVIAFNRDDLAAGTLGTGHWVLRRNAEDRKSVV